MNFWRKGRVRRQRHIYSPLGWGSEELQDLIRTEPAGCHLFPFHYRCQRPVGKGENNTGAGLTMPLKKNNLP
ncbi:MAG: hypothetical protein A2Z73_02905 [Deltaproteobacteria bacterium RBG_13_60_28]|nr:MAG: hypothetical protein A2Z73_02905 [Deltaproteobacteria bacterium RBG_13_60_28]